MKTRLGVGWFANVGDLHKQLLGLTQPQDHDEIDGWSPHCYKWVQLFRVYCLLTGHYKRVQLFMVYSLLTGQNYTELYITFTNVI